MALVDKRILHLPSTKPLYRYLIMSLGTGRNILRSCVIANFRRNKHCPIIIIIINFFLFTYHQEGLGFYNLGPASGWVLDVVTWLDAELSARLKTDPDGE